MVIFLLESKIQKKILDYLDSKGYLTVKIIQCNKRGVSDILSCSPSGQFVAIEVKSQTGVVSPLQSSFIAKVIQNGGIGFVARSVEDVELAINESSSS